MLRFKAARPSVRRLHLKAHGGYEHPGCTAARFWRVHHFTGRQLIDGSAWRNPTLGDPWDLGLGCAGVYVWHRRDGVLYVGRTDACLRKRLDSTLYRHHVIDLDGNVAFADGLAFYECKPEVAPRFERALIDMFKPRFNRT